LKTIDKKIAKRYS